VQLVNSKLELENSALATDCTGRPHILAKDYCVLPLVWISLQPTSSVAVSSLLEGSCIPTLSYFHSFPSFSFFFFWPLGEDGSRVAEDFFLSFFLLNLLSIFP